MKETFLSYRLKKLRTIKKIKQIELANFLNVSQNTISNWEKSIAEPSIENLNKLSKIFNVTTDYLMGLDYNTSEAIKIAKMKATLIQIKIDKYDKDKFEIEQEDYYQNYIANTKEEQDRIMEVIENEMLLKQTNPELYVETKIENAKFKAAKEVGLLHKYYPDRKDMGQLIDEEKIKSFEFKIEHIILDEITLKEIYNIKPN